MARITVGALLILLYVVLIIISVTTPGPKGNFASFSLGLAAVLVVPGLLLVVFGWRSRHPLWFSLRRLRSLNVEGRRAAAGELRELANKPYRRGLLEQVVEPLVAALSDEDPSVRADTALALAAVGRTGDEPLIHALDDSDENVRYNAARALRERYPTRTAMAEEFGLTKRPDAEHVLAAMTTALTVSRAAGDCCCGWETEILGEAAIRKHLPHLEWIGYANSGPYRGSEYRCQWTDAHWIVALDDSRMRRT